MNIRVAGANIEGGAEILTPHALNPGACIWLADMEDASTPYWANVVGSQVNLRDAIRRDVAFSAPGGATHTLISDKRLPTSVMRPRGWHVDERHLLVDGAPVVGALVNFGLCFFHNAKALLESGSGPYFYLLKLESHLEARLWNDVFVVALDSLGIPRGSVRATVLIETIPAAFEMEEILYELRDHVSGLNAGRWDYLFSMIKYFRDSGPEFVLSDRAAVGMTSPFMPAYAHLLVKTCHKRGALAIGGMSAFIQNRRNENVNSFAFAKVREGKEREAADGFDCSWVAHPDLLLVCQEVCDGVLGDHDNQIHRQRDDVLVSALDLLDVASTPGEVTREGLHGNVEVALLYLESWLKGNGAVAIKNLMEDAATAEICRPRIWQWVYNRSTPDDGTVITGRLVRDVLDEEVSKLRAEIDDYDDLPFPTARELFEQVALGADFADFLTLAAYEKVISA